MSSFKQAFDDINRFGVRNGDIRSNERVVAVDALRGFDMFWIMGGGTAVIGLDKVFGSRFTGFLKLQMDHVQWEGFRFWDIIMPLFMFLVGVSMVYSFRNRIRKGCTDKAIWKHTVIRFITLWILGMVVQGNLLTLDINQFQFYSNTLQAIAAGYLISTILLLYSSVKWQIAWTGILLAVYWMIMVLIPVGGTTAGAYHPATNVAITFDNMVLGRFSDGYTYAWIIPSINAGVTTMLGVFCGYLLQNNVSQKKKLLSFVIYGSGLVVLGLICSIWQPIIKKIWTSSFTLFSGGICVLLLALFYLIVDIWNCKKATKWMVVLGMNAIFGYVMWNLFAGQFMSAARVLYQGLVPYIGDWYSTVYNLGGFAVIFILMRYMYNNKTFIKI